MLGTEVEAISRTGDVLELQTNRGAVAARSRDPRDRLCHRSRRAAGDGRLRRCDPALGATGCLQRLGNGPTSPISAPALNTCRAARLPGLDRIHCFTHAAQLSLGNLSNDIPTVSEGAERLARAIASSLFVEDREWHLKRLHDYAEPELLGDEWPGLDAWDPPVS